MDIKGNLSDEELIAYIGVSLKLETVKNMIYSKEYSDSDKVEFLKMYLKES